MKRMLLALAIALMVVSTASASLSFDARPDQWTGHHWQAMTQRDREMFVAGVLTIMNPLDVYLGQTPRSEPLAHYTDTVDRWYKQHNVDRFIWEAMDEILKGNFK